MSRFRYADVIDTRPITIAILRAKPIVEDAEVCLLSHFVPGSRLTLVKVLIAVILATSGEAKSRRRRVLWCQGWIIFERDKSFSKTARHSSK